MVADSLDDSRNAGITHAEPFPGHTADIGFTIYRAIKRDITDNYVFLRNKFGVFLRNDNDLAAGKSFSDIVIAFASQTKRHAVSKKSTEALPGRTDKIKRNAVFRQTFFTVYTCDLRRKNRAGHTVAIGNFKLCRHFLSVIHGRLAQLHKGVHV